MLCQKCGKNEAKVQFTNIEDKKKQVLNLCLECAQEAGYENSVSSGSMVGSFLAGIIPDSATASAKSLPKLKCSGCGLTYAEFGRNGQLGCSRCYGTFFDHLKDLLRRIHGSTQHVGKVPRSSREKFIARRELNKLQQQMKKAIEKEDFEKAAGLRDQIRKLELEEINLSGGDKKK
jgi:protein arginine kinase activator